MSDPPPPWPTAVAAIDHLRSRLQRLHREQGEPSTRAISRTVLNALSHSTVGVVLRCASLPRWERLQTVVTALGGDVDEFRALWVAVRDAQSPMPPTARAAVPAAPGPPAVPPAVRVTGTTGPARHNDPGGHDDPAARAEPADATIWVSAPALIGHGHPVVTVAFTPDGSRLASAAADGSVRLWNLSRTPPNSRLAGSHHGPVWGLAFSPDGDLLASTSSDSTVHLFDLAAGSAITPDPPPPPPAPDEATVLLAVHTECVWAAAFSPDGTLLATGGDDRTAILWNPRTGVAAHPPLTGHTDGITCLAFSPDGTVLSTAGADAAIRLWDPTTGLTTSRAISGHEENRWSVAISPDGRTVAQPTLSTDDDGPDPVGHTDAVTCMTYSPDGQTLATAGADAAVWLWTVSHLWHPATGRLIGTPLRGHTDAIIDIAFSPTGLLASGSADGTVRLWNTATATPAHEPLQGHTGPVLGVAFDPTGNILATCSEDTTIRLWDPSTGRPLGDPLTEHTDAVTTIAFSTDGSTLASGSDDATLRLWHRRDPVTHLTELTHRLRDLQDSYDHALQTIADLEAKLRTTNP